MDIGEKIKKARIEANVTQEQIAEVLGVSRQTVSNWENGKTYPDIVSVIKMSDFYNISLDHLLKEEKKTMSNYVEYLKESTNVVKSKRKLCLILILLAYLVVWAYGLITFWCFTDGADAMGYAIMFLYLLYPIVTIVISVLLGYQDYFGKMKWLFGLFFGIMYMLSAYLTFDLANMLSFDKINIPNFIMIIPGTIFSIVGLGIGTFIRFYNNKKNS